MSDKQTVATRVKTIREAWGMTSRRGTHWDGCEFTHYGCAIRTLLEANDQLNSEAWTASRVIAWLDDPNRAPAIHAFTAGNERQIAYRVERLLANPATQDTASPKASNSTTVPDHGQAS